MFLCSSIIFRINQVLTNLFQAKFIAQCIEEIKQELRQDNISVKATAVAKLTYVSTYLFMFCFKYQQADPILPIYIPHYVRKIQDVIKIDKLPEQVSKTNKSMTIHCECSSQEKFRDLSNNYCILFRFCYTPLFFTT